MDIFIKFDKYIKLYHQNTKKQEEKIVFSKIYHNFATLRINNMDFKKYYIFIYLSFLFKLKII